MKTSSVHGSALAREPEAGFGHPAAQRLARDFQLMPQGQHLGHQGRAEIRVVRAHPCHGPVPHILLDAIVRRPATALVRQAAGAARPIDLQQPVHLPCAQGQDHRCGRHRPRPAHDLAQHLDPLQLPLAQCRPPQACSPNHDAAAGRLTFLLCSEVTL